MPRIAELNLNQVNPQIEKIDQLLKQVSDMLTRLQRIEFILKKNNLK